MPRSAEQNAQVRQTRKEQILSAALTVYVRFGFYGTDMDAVAQEAGLAKGLIYYYFKTKRELFAALYTQTLARSFAFSQRLLQQTEDREPIDRLMAYTYAFFAENAQNRQLMQFCIRLPFDAYAVFGPEDWKDGIQKSDVHRRALAGIIARGMAQGSIANVDPNAAAHSFWSVFVANAFSYARLAAEGKTPANHPADDFAHVVQFCFQGLGVERGVWIAAMNKILREKQQGGISDESLSE
ncbi:MAG TPA: TetR/AcrR family transcriptional regulator [Candidatus Limiplasma sp.]|nr:TetR/AcrR family transcriptional regulator [Candidatus Limiplasma sp.]